MSEKLNGEELNKVTGGTLEGAEAFVQELMEKSGVNDRRELEGKLTPEETEKWVKLLWE